MFSYQLCNLWEDVNKHTVDHSGINCVGLQCPLYKSRKVQKTKIEDQIKKEMCPHSQK